MSAQVTISPVVKQIDLERFPAWIRQSIDSQQSAVEILSQSAQLLCELSAAMWCGVVCIEQDGNSAIRVQHNGIRQLNLAVAHASVMPTFQRAISEETTVVTKCGPMTVIASPFSSADNALSMAIGLALDLGSAPTEPFLLAVQLAAAELSRLPARETRRTVQWQIEATAAIAELMAELAHAQNEQDAWQIAANRLNEFLGSDLFVLGQCPDVSNFSVRIMASSGSSRVDHGTNQTKVWREALQESCVRHSRFKEPTSCVSMSSGEDDDALMTIAHRYCLRQNLEQSPEGGLQGAIITSPLVSREGKRVGALGCIVRLPENGPIGGGQTEIGSGQIGSDQIRRTQQFMEVIGPYLCDTLALCHRAGQGALRRVGSHANRFLAGRHAAVTAVALAFLAGIMAMPMPYRVSAPVILTSAATNYAVAPYDGILERCLVEPGDVVKVGQPLARLDRSELELKRAELLAQRQRATKKRDVHRSAGEVSNMQIATFEEQQLTAQLELVDYRLANLEIVADANGVVLQSPMKDARNAPLKTGDVLVQFARLSELTGELEIAESELPYIQGGQSVEFVLDGHPLDSLQATLERVRPISEVRDGRNVFIGEFELSNPKDVLRPGMRGDAYVLSQSRLLGWILFHHAIEKVYRFLR